MAEASSCSFECDSSDEEYCEDKVGKYSSEVHNFTRGGNTLQHRSLDAQVTIFLYLFIICSNSEICDKRLNFG